MALKKQKLEFDFSNLSEQEKVKYKQLLEYKKEELKQYRIAHYKPINHSQDSVVNAVHKAVTGETETKLIWANGGNGSGKTSIWAFCLSSLASGKELKNIWARFIGECKRIAVFVENFDSVRKIEEYILSEPTFSESSMHAGSCRIPPQFIKKIQYSDSRPKSVRQIEMHNGAIIEFRTFSQGQKAAAGWNYDFVWIDEPPENKNTFDEIISRASRTHCVILLTATLASEKDAFIEEFFDTMKWGMKKKTEIYTLLSSDNPYADVDVLAALGEERLTGRKPERKWKVFYRFLSWKHIVEHFEPTTENMWWRVRYFMGVDPWANHPFAIVMFCIDEEWYIYIFKEILLEDDEQWVLNAIKHIVNENRRYPYEQIVVDMRDWILIKWLQNDLWMRNVVRCDKHTRWPKWQTNIHWRRTRINEYLYADKIMISSRCTNIIRQFSRLRYKDKVDETMTAKSDTYGSDDDAIDAFGYAFDRATSGMSLADIHNRNEFYKQLYAPKKLSSYFEEKKDNWAERKMKNNLNYVV